MLELKNGVHQKSFKKKKQLLLWTVLYIFLYNKISNHINQPQLKDASDPLFQYVKRISVLYGNF